MRSNTPPRPVTKRALALLPAGAIALTLSIALLAGGRTAVGEEAEPVIDARWWAPGEGRVLPEAIDYPNADGVLRTLLDGGDLETAGHPFFEPIGENGRACISCHQPADAMSLSAETAQTRWEQTDGADPIFAAIDGSDCPTLPQDERDSHSLLLDHGLFRIERPWPPAEFNGDPVEPDFTITTVRDPNGCNSGPDYGPDAGKVSVYRRPRPSANMKFLLAVGFAYDPKQGLALPSDPETGVMLSGNILSDNRASTLKAQMIDAAISHMEHNGDLTDEQIAEISQFLLSVYSAQLVSNTGLMLNEAGAEGGPELLRDSPPGRLGSRGKPVWSEFEAWENPDNEELAALSPEAQEFARSVARGARVYREKMFLITDSAGINSPIGFGNPVRNSCVFCHNMSFTGVDVAPGQVDIGTNAAPFADPAPHLPLFEITCTDKPHPHYGRVIHTTDPGFALTTGKCADVGKITLQSLRGLSARAPYFANGSAPDIRTIIDYYERRYDIGYTEQEKQDLVNLLSVL